MAEAEGSTLAPGTRVGGRFVVERLLRSEPRMEVYLVRAEGGGTARYELRRVQVPASAGAAGEQVHRELERVAALGFRTIPDLVAVALDPAGLVVVTEAPEALVPRDTLRDLVDRGERLPAKDVARIAREVGRTLDGLHALTPPMVHRTLTPENVSLLARRQTVWLTAAGLSHALVSAAVVGADAPMVPMEYRNPDELQQRATPRGDVFALASLVFEALTGRSAFRTSSDGATEASILRGPRPSVGDVVGPRGAAVDAVLQRAWSVEAEGGFLRASEFAAALERALDVTDEASRPLSTRTMIGIGSPIRAAVVNPRGAPARVPGPETTLESSRPSPRVPVPTQRVQVPRIHPPGTEPVTSEGLRDARDRPSLVAPPRTSVPPVTSSEAPTAPPAARISRAPAEAITSSVPVAQTVTSDPAPAPGDEPATERAPALEATGAPRDSWSEVLADPSVPGEIDEDQIPTRPPVTPPAPTTVQPAASPTIVPEAASAPPTVPSIPVVVSASATLRPVPVSDSPAPLVTEEPELQLEEVDPELVAPRVSRPPPPPPGARVSLPPPLPPTALASNAPPGASTIPPEVLEPMAPPSTPSGITSDDFDIAPLVPEVDAVVPPVPEDDLAVVPPIVPIPPSTPWPEAEPVPAPVAEPLPPREVPPSLVVGAYPALTTPPVAVPPKRSPRVLLLGAGVLVASLAAVGVWFVRFRGSADVVPVSTRQIDASAHRSARADVPVPADIVSQEARQLDAGGAASDGSIHIGATGPDVVPSDVVSNDVLRATPDATSAADVAVATAVDVGALLPPVLSGEPLRERPRGRDARDLEDAMYDEVISCVAGRHRRRVRVQVTYVGATGLAREVRISAPYDSPEIGPCIERVVRRHPVGRFTDETWDRGFVFDPEEE